MDLQAELAAELGLRTGLLPAEVAAWKAQTNKNEDRMGIHQNQVWAINALLDGLMENQTKLRDQLQATLPAEDFARKRELLEVELAGAHGIMATFRYILGLRAPGRYREALDASDLIAANCYDAVIDVACGWGLITSKEQTRVRPLTWLNAESSAIAYTRGDTFSLLGFELLGYRELKLPIPLISLPYHDTGVPWSYCSIYHEVGHLVDQDLGLTRKLSAPIEAALMQAKVPKARRKLWASWLAEVIGDVFGVLLGGPAFAFALQKMLLRPTSEVTRLGGDEHPNDYVRVFLLGAMLRELSGATGVEGEVTGPIGAWAPPKLVDAAATLEDTWRTRYGDPNPPSGPAPYLDDCGLIAATLLGTPLDGPGGHALRDMVMPLALSRDLIAKMVLYLSVKDMPRPDPATIPYRLLPAAAQIAVRKASGDLAQTYTGIGVRMLAFVEAIPRPDFLDAGDLTQARKDYLTEMAAQVRFGRA